MSIENFLCCLFFVSLFFPSPVSAHTLNESYFQIKIQNQSMSVQLELPLQEIEKALPGSTGDNQLDKVRISDYLRTHLKITLDHAPVDLQFTKFEKEEQLAQEYIDVDFSLTDMKKAPTLLEVNYNLFFAVDRQHRGLFYLTHNRDNLSAVFSAERTHRQFPLDFFSRLQQFFEFVKLGVAHIATGIDHILFILSLLLQSVVFRAGGQWQRVKGFRQALWNMIKVATIFTVAHSITLSLAALQIIELPSRVTESMIALSIVIAGLNIFLPIFGKRLGFIIFGFGLFHGLGFSSALTELGLTGSLLVTALFGFNIGVELGQIVVLFIFFPICYLLSKKDFYPGYVFRPASVVIILIAFKWFVERAFGP